MPCRTTSVITQDINGDGMLDRAVTLEKEVSMREACDEGRTFRNMKANQPLDGLQSQFLCKNAKDVQKDETVCTIIDEVVFTMKDGKTERNPNKVSFLAGDDRFVRVGDRVTMQLCEQRRIQSGTDAYSCTGQIKSFAVYILSDGKAVVEAFLSSVKGMPENVSDQLSDLKKAK